MKRDRMNIVLQVREGVERRRLAEQAAADLRLRLARQERESAIEARDERHLPDAATSGDLQQHRLASLALGDAVERARERERQALAEAEQANQRRIDAAIARRSAERLTERRKAEAAVRATRAADTRLDAVALETWRRRG